MSQEIKDLLGLIGAVGICVILFIILMTWNNGMMSACEESGGQVLTGLLDIYRGCDR